jgi:hypothetical protein
MPLSPGAPRKPIHTRHIECHGYLREDGLWDIEGHITDVKTYPFHNEWRGWMEPGTPIHDMTIRLTVDNAFVVQAVETAMDGSPYPICAGVLPNFQRLVGLQIQSGWRRRVRELLGGTEGCTHMVEMLSPLATVVLQTIRPYKRFLVKESLADGEADPTVRRPQQIDTCYSWSREREVVRRYLPEHFAGAAEDAPASAAPPRPTGR